jgi:hypothetical protein
MEPGGEGTRVAIDWRAAVSTTLAADWTSPWTGVTHAIGAPVSMVTPGRDARRRPLTFISPSPEALALDLAFAAAARTRTLRERVVVKPGSEPWNTSLVIDDGDLPALYDYFESCFVVVTFAYQAIEAFANREIEAARPQVPFEVVRRNLRATIPPDQLERGLSLSEKIGLLLPALFGVPTPKGRKPWAGFRALQAERDAIVHLKVDDAAPRDPMNKQSTFHRFWADGVVLHPANAVALIDWFYATREAPRWLPELRRLAMQDVHGSSTGER